MKIPTGMDERLEQYRDPVVKGEGVTETEKYLAQLAERSFLNLWSYPNPFRDQKVGNKGIGKELCDLLVVCDEHIIIFSEKNISWSNGDLEVAWARWAKAAIQGSLKQLKGAERWIRSYPDRICLDSQCEHKFPISLPEIENAKIHRIVVARGASEICRQHYRDGMGGLVLDPSIKGEAHWSNSSKEIRPFRVGDADPDGGFVHVLD